ncbi:MAG: RloB family protein [Patescibacteria group bacterium]|jgi:hypothetical protein|nr:RloB family protein [Patescibacteria group bacterium]
MQSRFKRKEGARRENKIIYIFTEGEKTEPIYFEFKKKNIESEIRRRGIKIEVRGTGFNTLSLVDFALDYVKSNNIDLSLDDCWIVFDKDDFNKDFDNAINKAQSHGLKVAYSNESFELWFLLHFHFIDSAITRNDYCNKLTDNYRKQTGDKKYKYTKSDNKKRLQESVTLLINLIQDKEINAIKRAKQLIAQTSNEKSFLKKNPSTTVYVLVEALNKLRS